MATLSSSTRTTPAIRQHKHNFIRDVFEDDRAICGWLPIPASTKFDPRTNEYPLLLTTSKSQQLQRRFVESITRDRRGHLWFATRTAVWTGSIPRPKPSQLSAMTPDAPFVGGQAVIEDSRG
jgi:hypothetical protein